MLKMTLLGVGAYVYSLTNKFCITLLCLHLKKHGSRFPAVTADAVKHVGHPIKF